MKDERIRRVLLLNIILGAVCLCGSMLFFEGEHASGVAAGAIIGLANLYLLVLMLRRMLLTPEQRGSLALRFILKYGLVALMIAMAVFVLRVSPLGFAAGFSTTVLSLIVGSLIPNQDPED